MTTSAPDRPKRQRNPRGKGSRLRDDIIDAATTLLERTGSEDALSLRAIARQIGIASPSIDRHFSDITEIIDAVVAKEATTLHQSLVDAAARSDDPRRRLEDLAAAYVDYARANPARYRVLVGRRFLDRWGAEGLTMTESAPQLTAIIDLIAAAIQACIDTGVSTSTDAYFDTYLLWFAVHGLITVTGAITSIDWPALDQLLDACITRAARLISPPATPRNPVGSRRSQAHGGHPRHPPPRRRL